MHKQRIAVVGSGISGLASAWLLSREHQVTLFEAGARLGGHTNTVDVTLEGKTHPVDTGFLVFNERTYPNPVSYTHLDVYKRQIYTHVLKVGGGGVRSPVDSLPEVARL